MTGGLDGARCAGRWWLFDSTDRRDHIAARQLCADCPAIAGCRELLQAALTAPCVQAGSGPIGTWAGLLFGRVGQNRPRVKQLSTGGVDGWLPSTRTRRNDGLMTKKSR